MWRNNIFIMRNHSCRLEGLADAALFLLIILPNVLIPILSLVCNGRDVGNATGVCSISILLPVYNLVWNFESLIYLMGFFLVGSIVFLSLSVSIFYKILATRDEAELERRSRLVNLIPLSVIGLFAYVVISGMF